MPTFHVYPDPDNSGAVIAKSDESDLIVRAPARTQAMRHVLASAEVGQHGLTEDSDVIFEHHTDPQVELHAKLPSYVGDPSAQPAVEPAAVAAPAPAAAPVEAAVGGTDEDQPL